MRRRGFIQGALGAGVLGTAGCSRLASSTKVQLAKVSALPPASREGKKIEPRADAMILLWMGGGQAQTETWDPKTYVPFETGMESKRCICTFRSIPTSVDNIQISEGMPRIAKTMHLGALARSFVPENLAVRLHTPSQHHFHTGYVPPIGVKAPSIGSIVARTLGRRHPEVPAHFDIGRMPGQGVEVFEVKAFHTAGFLGDEYGPFEVPDPTRGIDTVRPPEGMDDARFEHRWKMLEQVARARGQSLMRDDKTRRYLEAVEGARRIMNSPAAKAFDLSQEKKEIYDDYNTGRFGLGCLLGRRLVESGARFVEVEYEFVPFKGWDTHEDGHTRTAKMMEEIDRPISRLLLDLEERGLLARTLVVLASEFGRDPVIDGHPNQDKEQRATVPTPPKMEKENHYGMHQHFTGASSVALWGGGVKKGLLYGKTADEHPCVVTEKPLSVTDLHSTIYHALGIPADTYYTVEERPFYVTQDGKGVPVMELLA